MFWLPHIFFAAALGMVSLSGTKHAKINSELTALRTQLDHYPNGAAQYFRQALTEIFAAHEMEVGNPPSVTVRRSLLVGAESKKTGDRFFFLIVMGPNKQTGKLSSSFYYLATPEQMARFPRVTARSMLPTRRANELMEWDDLDDVNRFIEFQGDEILLNIGVPIIFGGEYPITVASEKTLSDTDRKKIEALNRWTYSFRNDSSLFSMDQITQEVMLLKEEWQQELLSIASDSTSGECGPLLH